VDDATEGEVAEDLTVPWTARLRAALVAAARRQVEAPPASRCRSHRNEPV
jgi:hypothetical protein